MGQRRGDYAERGTEVRRTVSLVLPERLIRLIKRQAERNGKSVSSTASVLLEEALYGKSADDK